MGDTPGRMLQLLSFLQARNVWPGAELAERLEITERTLRRDIDRLRTLGYPVEAAPGRAGGYRLGRGGHLPPLLLNDDEAVAVAIGLRSAVDGSVIGLEEHAVSTLAKLEKLLPAHVASRVRAFTDSTAQMVFRRGEKERIDATVLLLFARACSARQRVRFDYVDRTGKPSDRLVEPLGLVRYGSRWYLVAYDQDRAAWRTFRLDRVQKPANVGTTFERGDDVPDPVAFVAEGLQRMDSYPFRARIRLPVSVEEAARLVPRTLGVFVDDTGPKAGTFVELGAPSLERMVSYLSGLNPPCQVIEPEELRRSLAEHARAVAQANEPGAQDAG